MNRGPMKSIFSLPVLSLTLALCLPGALPGVEAKPPVIAGKIRARDLGIQFQGTPGTWNAITDVPGVEVGHSTIVIGEGELVVGEGPVRTGVTAILPTGKEFRKVFAATASLNGNGELTGTHWVNESGFLEEPILFTNTHSVGAVHQAVIQWRQERMFHPGDRPYDFASLPVVGETWDGRLNDIHGFHVGSKHVFEALDKAGSGAVAEGNVGGGTGMVCFRFKGGIGTASRITSHGYVVGVIVQANFGLREDLRIDGVPVGRQISDLLPEMNGILPRAEGNSILVAVATNAPLLPVQLKRLAGRVPLGIQRTGGMGYNSSGDLFIAFSTAVVEPTERGEINVVRMITNDHIDPFFKAVVESTEEAIINALVAARTMTGINNNRIHSIPHERLRSIFEGHPTGSVKRN